MKKQILKLVVLFLTILLSFSFFLFAPILKSQANGPVWPMFMHDPQHTGRSPYAGPVSSRLKWVLPLESPEDGAIGLNHPSIGEDSTIYWAGYNTLYAIRPDGTIKWSYDYGYKISFKACPALCQDGKIIFGTHDCLIALNPDGSEAWVYEVPVKNFNPTIWQTEWGDEIYFGSQNGNLYRLNLEGKLLSLVPTGGEVHYGTAFSTDGTYYFGSEDGFVYAVHPSRGVLWKHHLGCGQNASPAVGPDGTIYFQAADGKLYALNPIDGTLKWSIPFGFCNTPAIGGDGTLYIGNLDHKFYALNPQDGSVKWEFQTGGQIYSSATIDANGNIYFGSRDKKVYALRSDGSLLWSFETGGTVDSSPAIAADGTLYITSRDGNLYAFGTPQPPSIGIIHPQYGNEVPLGQAYQIRWETMNPPQGVYMIRIELSLNGGPFQVLAEGQDTGFYSWTPESVCENARLRISLLNADMEKLAEATSGVFRIVSSEIYFSDLPSDYWAREEILALSHVGVINGYPDGTFRPENPVTRAEFAKMALLTLGFSPENPENPAFPDVPKTEWYYQYVEGAVKHGLVKGYPDGNFKPEESITIAEVLTVIVRSQNWALQNPPGPPPYISLHDRDDSMRPINPSDWYYQYVGAAAQNGLLKFPDYQQITAEVGSEGYYLVKFNSPASRAQTAVLLSRLLA